MDLHVCKCSCVTYAGACGYIQIQVAAPRFANDFETRQGCFNRRLTLTYLALHAIEHVPLSCPPFAEMSEGCCLAPLFSALLPLQRLVALPVPSALKTWEKEEALDEAGRVQKWSSALSECPESLVSLCKDQPGLFKELVEAGVPSDLRWEVWKAALGGLRCGQGGQYQELLQKHSGWEPLIEKDSARTFLVLSVDDMGRHAHCLQNICKAYANLNPEIGYCQGMNFIVGLLLLVSDGAEEETFWVFAALMHDLELSGLYAGGFPLLRRYMDGFGQLIAAVLPRHSLRLQAEDIHLEEFLQSWYLSLFVTCLPKAAVVEVWDEIICLSGLPSLVPLSVALLECVPIDSQMRVKLKSLNEAVASKACAIAQFLRRPTFD